MGVKVKASDAPSVLPPPTIRGFLAAERSRERKAVRAVAGPAIWSVLAIVRTATSYSSFVAALVGLFYLMPGSTMLIVVAQVLRAQYRNANTIDRAPPSLWFCIVKLAKRTCVRFVVLFALVMLMTFLLSLAPTSVRSLKLEFYIGSAFTQSFVVTTDQVARKIIRREMITRRQSVGVTEGALQQQPQHEEPSDQPQPAPPPSLPKQKDEPPSQQSGGSIAKPPRTVRRSARRSVYSKYLRHVLSTFAHVGFIFVAGVYVELTRRHVDLSHGETMTLFIFTAASTLLKVTMQELAKRAAMRRGVRDIRPMCVMVGVPTVLIDTQIRLVVQRFGSRQDSFSGTLFMALLEVAMRVGKVWVVKWDVYHREHTAAAPLSRGSTITAIVPFAQGSDTTSTAASASSAALATRIEFERWKHNVWKLYMAEVHADMAAEYIAIGCSTSILYFYSTHPRYELCADGCTTQSALDQVASVATQVAVEIAVDVFATILELRGGMDVLELRKHSAFIVTFFAVLAVVNIEISSAFYLITPT